MYHHIHYSSHSRDKIEPSRTFENPLQELSVQDLLSTTSVQEMSDNLDKMFLNIEEQIAVLHSQKQLGNTEPITDVSERATAVESLREESRYFMLCQMAQITCSMLYKILFPDHYSPILCYKFSKLQKDVNNAMNGKCRSRCKNYESHCEHVVKFWRELSEKLGLDEEKLETFDYVFKLLQEHRAPCRKIMHDLRKELLLEATDRCFSTDDILRPAVIEIVGLWEYLKLVDAVDEPNVTVVTD